MQSIEQKALQTYKANLSYFEKNHLDLYKKIILLETSINQGIYKEQYSLEYKEEGYFDIQELSTGYFLYGENSNEYTKKLLNIVDMKRTGSVFEAQQRFNIKEEELEEIEDFKNFHSSLWATAKILHYNSKIAPKESSKMQKLYKFMFIGLGLSLHVKSVIETYNIQVAFIYEKNLEIFRLSLFTTEYSSILKNKIAYFSIMQDFYDLQNTFTNFLSEAFNYNLYIKFLPFSQNYNEDIKIFQSITLSQDYIAYPYQGYMARTFNTIQKITSSNLFLNISNTYIDTTLTDKPILVLASGPSVQNNIKWIKQNQKKFLIIAVLSACKYLFINDVTPDIVVHIDPQETATLALIENIDMSKFNNSQLVFGSTVHKKVIERFNRNDIIFIEQGTSYKVGYGFLCVSTIGEYAVALPLILGAMEIYVLGLDLALDPKTMKDHIDLHIGSAILSKNENEESVKFQGSICYVKGNFQDIVPSKPNFRFSITQFNKILKLYKQSNQNIYNLSNGAFLENTIPLKVDNFDLTTIMNIDKNHLSQSLKDFFTASSSSKFRDEDKEYLEKQLDISLNIINKCHMLSKVKSKEIDNYLFNKLLPFVKEISEMNKEFKSDMGEIFYEYFKISLSFIFDTFNTADLKNTKKHIRDMDELVLYEVEKIASTYHSMITKYIENN